MNAKGCRRTVLSAAIVSALSISATGLPLNTAFAGTAAGVAKAKTNAIIGTGADAIIGTGADAIIGTGADAIIGTGADAIIGTGADAIIGTGKGKNRPSAIIGTGADAIIGTGADAIIGTGADAIIGTGKARPSAIIGTGADAIIGTGADAIVGTGADAIIGTGADAIIGTGADAIIGTGADAIIGTGADAIVGTGADAIIGTGADAIIGTGRQAEQLFLVVKGPVDWVDRSTESLSVLGHHLHVSANSSLASYIEQNVLTGNTVELSVVGKLDSRGNLTDAMAQVMPSGYVPGVTEIVLTGRVRSLDSRTGKAVVGNVVVDLNSLPNAVTAGVSPNKIVTIKGTQPQFGQEILATKISIRGK